MLAKKLVLTVLVTVCSVGEFVSAIILMFIGFCVGIMPVVVCVCFYEFKDAFPDPDEVDSNTDEDDSDTDDEHLKKE